MNVGALQGTENRSKKVKIQDEWIEIYVFVFVFHEEKTRRHYQIEPGTCNSPSTAGISQSWDEANVYKFKSFFVTILNDIHKNRDEGDAAYILRTTSHFCYSTGNKRVPFYTPGI